MGSISFEIVPDRLRLARKNKKLSQAELAKRCKVDVGTISRLERGKSLAVSVALLDAIRRQLEVGGYWLLGVYDFPTMPEYPTPDEKELLETFRTLDEQGRRLVLNTIREAVLLRKDLAKIK